jgi:RimJ/RimL family protein N-acetyltransferase
MTSPAIRILRPGDEAALETFLLPRVEYSMFLLSNLRQSGLRDTGKPYAGTYAAAFQGEDIVSVVAHYWNGNLCLQAPVNAAGLCKAAVRASGRPVSGWVGPLEQVKAASQPLCPPEAKVQLDEAELHYALSLQDLEVPAILRSGHVRARSAEPRDLELLTRWRVAYSIETTGDRESPELWQKAAEGVGRLQQQGHTWVLEADGQPAACCSFNAAIQEAVQLGGVWTPPHLRCRGYARAVVAASLLDARDEGVDTAILFTGVDNLAAQAAYQALGFRHVGAYCLLLLHQPIALD